MMSDRDTYTLAVLIAVNYIVWIVGVLAPALSQSLR
jgi:hypothetical protein